MRELVILSYSSIATPSHNHHHHHNHNPIKPFKPTTTKLSPSKPPPPPPQPQPPLSTLNSPSPLLSSRHTLHLKYYANLASKLAEQGKLQDFAMIVETVIVSGADASQFVSALSVELVAKGITVGLREGKVRSVIEVLRKVEQLGVAPLKLFDGSTMELLGNEFYRIVQCGKVEEVVEFMEILAGFRFSIKELLKSSDIIRACVDKRNPKLAIRYACILPYGHILFSTIIHEFGKKGDLVSALTAYEASKQHLTGPNMYVYRTIIDVCGLCGDFMKSRYIYEDLLKQKITPNIYVFNSLMNVNAHDLSYTLHVHKNMRNLGVMEDMASYNILLKACCLAGRVDLAQDIYMEVQHLESTGVLKLDVFTYSTIVKVFADAKLWQMALHIKEDMLSAGVAPNTVAWSSLIRACANAGLVERAIQLFDEMLLAGCEPNTQCCNILLDACVETCQFDRAFRLFQSWKGGRVSETIGECNINLNAEHGDKNCSTSVPTGLSTSHHLNYPRKFPFTPTTATYNILMKACGTDYYRAKALIYEMKVVGLSPNHITWSILIDICGGTGNVEDAMRIFRHMLGAGIQPDVIAYTTAIKVCVESENLKLAFSLFQEMKNYQIRPNMVTYNTLLRARSRYGSLDEVQQCLSVYQDMRRAGYKPNDYYLEELIEEWCEGVIQVDNQNKEEFSSCNKTYLGRPQSLLLEKIAMHLQKSNSERLTIDLQGLTKVEARIVVLAVLRMFKENYHTHGHSVNDDIVITLGVSKVVTDPATHNLEVKSAIIKLLQDELGLEVLLAGPRNALNKKKISESLLQSDLNFEQLTRRKSLLTELESSTRRPDVVQRLKVTRKSLQYWLQRRLGAIRR
ncbi:pentatricopeptide repeat-containing protein At5g02830, chloroplastic isoform X1 [Castanea sativa]|uniref:pentatricopeptide repeat-containing protein At5g02830, chloroplastic isoform X1 n=1 Tax=Castanea sativa TaxID=21020 RepID=UPI003F64C21C